MKKTIHQLKGTLPQIGVVQWIGVRPIKRDHVQAVQQVEVDTEQGIIGDHYSKAGGSRMVTLIQAEHIEAMEKILEKSIQPELLRRNIVVSGINLLALHDAQFVIGESLLLEGTGYCHPCSRMEENLGPGGYNAMRGHGGLTAKVIHGGAIKLGDQVMYVQAKQKDDE